MDVTTMFKNGALDSARRNLADNPKALKLAAKVFDKAKGTTQERLLFALDTAIESLKVEVELLELPSDLKDKTCAWLREFAEKNDIWCPGSARKDELISYIEHEASNRRHFS